MKQCDNEKGHNDMRCSAGLLTTDSSRRESQSESGGHSGPDVKVGAISSHNTNKQPDFEMIRGSKQLVLLASSEGAQSETLAHCTQTVSKSQKGSGSNILAVDNTDGDDVSKVPKQIRKADLPNEIPHNSSRSSMPNRHRVRDLDASSPVGRDSSSQAANSVVKEAKTLKHTADRLKVVIVTYYS
uniref:Uncharacterized protein LOC105642474 n=1 Tax=Rhizophora mucronata TaxID=61149 RepID=A0A2P2JHL1_RHIMU